jgi:hypothetical protein
MTKSHRKRPYHRPDIHELHSHPGFRQILELDFRDMIPFVLSNIKRKGTVSLLYAVVNAGLLSFIVVYTAGGIMRDEIAWLTAIKQFIAGIFCGSILIIPVHELIHGLAYRILGARKIHFGADLQQLVFYVTADQYPVSGKELYFLAMLPFAAINIICGLTLILLLPQFIILGSFLLLSHNIMCIGDFAVVNYVTQYNVKVYSYDIVSEMKSYFFAENGNTVPVS